MRGLVYLWAQRLAVGTSVAITIETLAPTSAGIITNTVTISANTADPNIDNNEASAQTEVVFRVYLPAILNQRLLQL